MRVRFAFAHLRRTICKGLAQNSERGWFDAFFKGDDPACKRLAPFRQNKEVRSRNHAGLRACRIYTSIDVYLKIIWELARSVMYAAQAVEAFDQQFGARKAAAE
jgi:hypothetical protein